MQAYLVVITTVLVLTQIIRVTQNWMQLRRLKTHDALNKKILIEWRLVTDKLYEVAVKLEKGE